MNKQVSYAYQHLSRTETLFKGENKNINISVSKNSPVNASLSLDGYKHSMVQIIALGFQLVAVNGMIDGIGSGFNSLGRFLHSLNADIIILIF